MIFHGVIESAIYKFRLTVKGKLSFYGAVFINQSVTHNAVEIARSRLYSEIFKGKGRTALIIKLTALGTNGICDNINRLSAVADKSDVTGFTALVCNSVVKSNCLLRRK